MTGFVLGPLASVATPEGRGPKRGSELDSIREIFDAALVIEDGKIAWVGEFAKLPAEYASLPRAEAPRLTALPGLVDPHTHLVFDADRAAEFDLRARGAEYLEILKAGGGILKSVERTRERSEDELFEQALGRIQRILANGTTVVEIKSGYGLDTETEAKMLRVARRLGEETPLTVKTTFLGAHATPPEFRGDPSGYAKHVAETMLPAIHKEGLADYADIFCEDGVFGLEDSEMVLSEAQKLGIPTRMHADEVHPMGGGALAAKLGCVSADHLIATDDASIEALANSDTAATVLPGTAFVLGKGRYAPARKMLEAGCILAMASDLNPGSCHLEALSLAQQISVVQMRLTPAEALTASTLNAAYTLGLSEELGTLEPGKRANLTLIEAPDYRHFTYRLGVNLVRSVWIDGQVASGWNPSQTN